MVSGFATEATSARHFRPSRLPISASVKCSPSESRSRPETWERKIRFSAIRYSHWSEQALIHQARHVRQQPCPAVVLHAELNMVAVQHRMSDEYFGHAGM